MVRRIVLLVASLFALTACRLDVSVAVQIDPDGTGTVTVTAVADEELIAQVPELADDLRLDDAAANGWVVTGPETVDGGGLTITLVHEVRSSEELANVLNSIGPPLTQMAAARTTQEDQTTNAINGELVLANGFESFADAELTQAVGGLPFAEEISASGLTPSEAMSFTFQVELPGELVSTTGREIESDVFEWRAALDGTQVNLLTQTVQRPAGTGGAWAGPLSTLAFVALVVWVVLATAFIAFVAFARRKKQRRRDHALRHLR